MNDDKAPRVIALVPSAGSGTRMGTGSDDKPFTEIAGRPLLLETLSRLNSSSVIDAIIVIAKDNYVARVKELVSGNALEKVINVISGGKTRTGSVSNGLKAASLGDEDIVVIHDGARPFITDEMLIKSVDAAKASGAAIVAVPCTATIKKIDAEGSIDATVDRSVLWEAQTPQVFKGSIIKEAYAASDEEEATDDAALVEKLGRKVSIVKGDRRNIKITVPEDVNIAEAILAAGGK